MTDDLKEVSLDEIIDDLVVTEAVLDAQTMTRWIKRYPQYERELMDLAARWGLLTHLPPDESPLADEEAFYARGLEVVRSVMTEGRGSAARDEEPITSIVAEGQRQGLNVARIAALTDLSVPIIMKFEHRLITFSSIPREAVTSIARVIKRSFESVAAYLERPPGFAAGASFKSETSPTLPAQQEFKAAVKSDRTLSDEKRSHWLEIASSSEGPR